MEVTWNIEVTHYFFGADNDIKSSSAKIVGSAIKHESW